MDRVHDTGGPPTTGWAKLAPELLVSDIDASLGFWRGILGFEIAYQRPEEKFFYLEHAEGHQVMLCQWNGRWETGSFDYPLGRGVMFQLYFKSIEPALAAVSRRRWSPRLPSPRRLRRRRSFRPPRRRLSMHRAPKGPRRSPPATRGTMSRAGAP